MVTKEEFLAYEEVRESGETNMFHSANVIRLAKEMSGVVLGKGVVMEIMYNYTTLKERFENECDECGGTGEVTTMEQVYANEPHMAPIGTRPCPKCRSKKEEEYNDQD